MTYAIESGIEIPTNAKPKQEKVDKYPYAKMGVGDSFLVPSGVRGGSLGNICAMNKKMGERLGHRFVARTVEGGVRVWRVNDAKQ